MYRSGGDYSSSGRGSSGSRDRYERDRVPSRYRSPSPGYDRYRSSGGGGGSSSRYDRSPPRRRSPSPPRYRSSGGSSSRYRSPSPGPSYGRHGGSSGRDTRRRDSPDRHEKRRDRSCCRVEVLKNIVY